MPDWKYPRYRLVAVHPAAEQVGWDAEVTAFEVEGNWRG